MPCLYRRRRDVLCRRGYGIYLQRIDRAEEIAHDNDETRTDLPPMKNRLKELTNAELADLLRDIESGRFRKDAWAEFRSRFPDTRSRKMEKAISDGQYLLSLDGDEDGL